MRKVMSRWAALLLSLATLATGITRRDDDDNTMAVGLRRQDGDGWGAASPEPSLNTYPVTRQWRSVLSRLSPLRLPRPAFPQLGHMVDRHVRAFVVKIRQWRSVLSRLSPLRLPRPALPQLGHVVDRCTRRLGDVVRLQPGSMARLTLFAVILTTTTAAGETDGTRGSLSISRHADPDRAGGLMRSLGRRFRYWVNDGLNEVESLIVAIRRPSPPASSSDALELRLRGRAIRLLEEARVEDDDWYPEVCPGDVVNERSQAADDIAEAVPESS